MKITVVYPSLQSFDVDALIENKILKEGYYKVDRNSKGEIEVMTYSDQERDVISVEGLEWFGEIDLSQATLEKRYYFGGVPCYIAECSNPIIIYRGS